MKTPLLLQAGKIQSREDLNRQLGFDEMEEARWPIGWIVLGCAVFILIIQVLIIAGLTYPQWKHLLK